MMAGMFVIGGAMARLTKSEAARQLGISRTYLYKLINDGHVSPAPDGMIDTVELVRVAPLVDSTKKQSRTSMDSTTVDTDNTEDNTEDVSSEAGNTVVKHVHEHLTTDVNRQEFTAIVDILREQLQEAQERERHYQEQIERLTHMLEESQQQTRRLLPLPVQGGFFARLFRRKPS
jgi:hypothetical protein